MKLKRNMGPTDQAIRAGMGAGLLYLGPIAHVLTSDVMSRALLALVGLLTLASASIGYCPLYHIAGFCTYKPNRPDESSDR